MYLYIDYKYNYMLDYGDMINNRINTIFNSDLSYHLLVNLIMESEENRIKVTKLKKNLSHIIHFMITSNYTHYEKIKLTDFFKHSVSEGNPDMVLELSLKNMVYAYGLPQIEKNLKLLKVNQ